MNTLIPYFRKINASSTEKLPLDKIIARVRKDSYLKEVCERLRKLPGKENKKERDALKKEFLPAITVSAVCEWHDKKDCTGHTGFLVLDYDNMTKEELEATCAIVAADLHVQGFFISPSGDGLKVIINVAGATLETHELYFDQLKQYYAELTGLQADKSGRNFNRLCYLSHDPNAFLTTDQATPFQLLPVAEPEGEPAPVHLPAPPVPPKVQSKTTGKTDDLDGVLRLVEELEENRIDITDQYSDWVKIGFSLANLGEQGRGLYHRVSAISAKYDAAQCDKQYNVCLKSGNATTIGSFIFMANTAVSPYRKAAVTRAATKAQSREEKPELNYFYAHLTHEGKLKEIKIDNLKLLRYVRDQLGFRRLETPEGAIFVKVAGRIMKRVERRHIIDAVFDDIATHEQVVVQSSPDRVTVSSDAAITRLLVGQSTFLSDEKLLHLREPGNDYDAIKHGRDYAWFFYANGGVKVTKDGITLMPYDQLKGYVWQDTAHARNYVPDTDFEAFAFKQFVFNISAKSPDITDAVKNERYVAFRTLIGYLLHDYFSTKRKAVCFTDSRMSQEASGRSGKTLLCEAIMRVINSTDLTKFAVQIDGKSFMENDRFKYQTASSQTRFIVINDLAKFFEIDSLFNDITEGITVQPKNKDPFRIHAKMALTTNKTPKVEGPSAQDRVIMCELTDCYGKDFQPANEFGHWFFSDWNEKQWQAFDCFMLDCVRLYLKYGLLTPCSINLEQRYVMDRTHPDFVDWWNYAIAPGDGTKPMITPGSEHNKKELYAHFQGIVDMSNFKHLSSQRFFSWINIACQNTPGFSAIDTKLHQRQSNGNTYLTIPATPVDPSAPVVLPAKDAEKLDEDIPF